MKLARLFACGFAVLLSFAPLSVSAKSSSSSSGSHAGHVSVKEYTKKDGTKVEAHHRSAPNSTKEDNWSTKGNENPDTGKKGTKKP
jgi:hypothetical protein